MTRDQLVTKLLGSLDAPTDGGGQYTRQEAVDALDTGTSLLAGLTYCVERSTSITIPTQPFFRIRAYLPDYLAPLRIECNGQRVIATTLSEMDALEPEWMTLTDSQVLRYGSLGFGFFWVYPFSSGGTALTVRYAAEAAPLADGGQEPEVDEQYHDTITRYGRIHLTVKEGGERAKAVAAEWRRFLEEAANLGNYVRARSRGSGYDSLPPEIVLRERSRESQASERP